MNKDRRGILILSPFFSPNVGGVETHLDNLVTLLDDRGYEVFVQTYNPLTTPGVRWESVEDFGHVHIRRYGWFGRTLLHKLEKYPILDFLYLTPYLLFRVFIFMMRYCKQIDLIHAQGMNAALIGALLKKVFKKPLVVSTHALYDINPALKTAHRVRKILNEADLVFALTRLSFDELSSFGIPKDKLRIYHYWVDLDHFKPLPEQERAEQRAHLNLKGKFSVLFAGRLTEIKGVKVLVAVAQKLSHITFIFIGAGPLESFLKEASKKTPNIHFFGKVANREMYRYFNAVDLFCIPSQYKEGLARVMVEALACGLPIVGSNKGCIPVVLDESVSMLLEPTAVNLKGAIDMLSQNHHLYEKLRNNCRNYAEKNFGIENAETIIKAYGEFLSNT